MKDNDNSALTATTASGLVTTALVAALMGTLASKGVLSDSEIHEIYETALLSLEENHANADSLEFAQACQSAREVIEDTLNSMANKFGTPPV